MDAFRILLIDADPAVRREMREILADFSVRDLLSEEEITFAVEEADGACCGCARIMASAPHLLILDKALGCPSGADILEQVRTGRREMLFLMTDAEASIAHAVEVARRGAIDLLPKPFTPEALRASVARAVHQYLADRQAQAHEEEKRRLRFAFVSTLAHELKAPLAAVESCLNVLDSRPLGEQLNAYGEFIDRSRARLASMRHMVDDLLDLTRIESGDRIRSVVFMDLVDCARKVLDTLSCHAEPRRIALHLEGPEILTARADPWEMETLITNLVSNAIKYNRPDGAVYLRLHLTEEEVEIIVADTGFGMTPQEQARLFQEFGRVKNRNTDGILGTGLGLSIIRQILSHYDGRITVESAPEKGSIFSVFLPRCVGADQTPTAIPCSTDARKDS